MALLKLFACFLVNLVHKIYIQMSEFKIKISNIKEKFGNEKDAHFYLASKRWKDGEITCPHCGNGSYYVFKDGIRYKCKSCLLLFNAKTGTFMESSKLPTYKWIYSMYLLMQKKGISSVQLAEILEIQQRSAWFVLQRLRWAMGNDGEGEKLEGAVSIDAAAIGGKNGNRHWDKKYKYSKGRAYPDKTTVIGLCQAQGRIKTFVVKSENSREIKPLVYGHVKLGSILVTDEFKVYENFRSNFEHQICNHNKGLYVSKDGFSSNNVENFWSHLKRGLNGIYIKVSKKHLQKYLHEFQFRHNYRKLGIPNRIDMILENMECRLKYRELVA